MKNMRAVCLAVAIPEDQLLVMGGYTTEDIQQYTYRAVGRVTDSLENGYIP